MRGSLWAVSPGGSVGWGVSACFSICASQVAAQFVPLGSEFTVAASPSVYGVAAAPDGDFVIVWDGDDGSAIGVFGRRYMSNGQAIGTEFQVNSYTTDDQEHADVAVGGDGSFVVTWTDAVLDGDIIGVFAQRYSSSGQRAGTQFQVNTYTPGQQFDTHVAAGPTGDFVIVWTSSAARTAPPAGVFGQRFNSSGQTQGTEFLVNTFTQTTQGRADIASDATGNFIVVWRSGNFYSSDPGQDGSSYGIFGQRYASAGQRVGTEFQVNTYTTGGQEFPAVGVDSDGDFVVAWEGPSDIFAQRFASAGQSLGTEFRVNGYTAGSHLRTPRRWRSIRTATSPSSGSTTAADSTAVGEACSAAAMRARGRSSAPSSRSTPTRPATSGSPSSPREATMPPSSPGARSTRA